MKKAPETVCRINKSSLDSLSDKRMYYYMDFRNDDSEEVFYVLVDNRKGEKTLTEYDSINNIEEALKK